MKPLDPIILLLKLSDGSTAQYVRAWLYNNSNEQLIVGSPFNLASVGMGTYKYSNSNLVFPENVFSIRAEFVVYSDPNYTVPNTSYPQVMDIFQLSSSSATSQIYIQSQLEKILSSQMSIARSSSVNIKAIS